MSRICVEDSNNIVEYAQFLKCPTVQGLFVFDKLLSIMCLILLYIIMEKILNQWLIIPIICRALIKYSNGTK